MARMLSKKNLGTLKQAIKEISQVVGNIDARIRLIERGDSEYTNEGYPDLLADFRNLSKIVMGGLDELGDVDIISPKKAEHPAKRNVGSVVSPAADD